MGLRLEWPWLWGYRLDFERCPKVVTVQTLTRVGRQSALLKPIDLACVSH